MIMQFCDLLCFPVRRSQPRPRLIRISEEHRPFNYSCAVGGKIVSFEWTFWTASLPGVVSRSAHVNLDRELTGNKGERRLVVAAPGVQSPNVTSPS
jgi:hypothetical protein